MGLVKTNTLNIKYFSIISIILSISFFQCDKFSSSTWLYYNQTSCSDKWGLYTNFDDLKQKVENYIQTKKSIKVYDVEVLSNGPEQNCLACTCTTGNIIKLKVMTGDVAELKAISAVFGSHAKNININSTKSMTGHLLGAAGAIEAIASILAMKYGIVPPTINHTVVDENIDPSLNLTLNKAQKREINVAMSNTFGFGGHNACVLFKKLEA